MASRPRVLGAMTSLLRPRTVLLALLFLLLSACSSDGATTAAEEVVSAEPASDVPDTAPAIDTGGVATGSVEIDGTTIDYVTSVPDGFAPGDEAPLLLAFGGGSQTIGIASASVEGTYGPEARRLGWVVISPAAPDGVRYFDGSEALVPGFLDWVETWVTPEGGAPHVAGISNGGISSFRYAVQNPDRVQSVISFPGFPRGDADRAALPDLTAIPIRMYVGETDTNWIPPAEQAVEIFTEAGGNIELTIFAGEGHIMDSTRDGTVIFEQLESFR